jgi:hypothetical protein
LLPLHLQQRNQVGRPVVGGGPHMTIPSLENRSSIGREIGNAERAAKALKPFPG